MRGDFLRPETSRIALGGVVDKEKLDGTQIEPRH